MDSNMDLKRVCPVREPGFAFTHHQVVAGHFVHSTLLGKLLIVDKAFYSGDDCDEAVDAFWNAGRSGMQGVHHYVDGKLITYSMACY